MFGHLMNNLKVQIVTFPRSLIKENQKRWFGKYISGFKYGFMFGIHSSNFRVSNFSHHVVYQRTPMMPCCNFGPWRLPVPPTASPPMASSTAMPSTATPSTATPPSTAMPMARQRVMEKAMWHKVRVKL